MHQRPLIGLLRLHVQLTKRAAAKRARLRQDDAELRALVGALRVVEAEATEEYGFVLALIARDAVEAEAGGCCRCHDGAVAEAIGRVVGASMFTELNIHGRCPPCRDARTHSCGRVTS